MLTQTSITAVRLLIHLEREANGKVGSLKLIAEALGESPSYLVKIASHLVRAGILRAQHGQTGGVIWGRETKDIALLAIVEACQGAIHGNFCQDPSELSKTCALHQAIIKVLSGWTLSDFCKQPCPSSELRSKVRCLLEGGRPGLPSQGRGRR